MGAVPTNSDLLHAAIYAENVILFKQFPNHFPASLRTVQITPIAWTEKEIRIENEHHRTILQPKYQFQFNDANQCESFSCFPYTYQGNICLPQDPLHRWETITRQIFESCQPSCYNVVTTWDPEQPSPTMPELIYHQGKCLITNSSLKIYALFPHLRDEQPVDGFTNVPMWKHLSDPTLDFRTTIRITSEYCQWFALSHRNDECYNPPGQWLMEQIFGTTITRFVGRNHDLQIRRNESYTTLLSNSLYHQMLSTRFGQSIDRKTRFIFQQKYPQIRARSYTKYLVNAELLTSYESDTLTEDISLPLFQRNQQQSQQQRSSDGGGSIMDSVVNGELLQDILIGLIIDGWTDRALSLIKKSFQLLLKKLSSKFSQMTFRQMLQMGGRKIITSCLKASAVKFISPLAARAMGGAIAKLIAGAILKSLIAATNVVTWIFAVISIAGVILDLLDVGKFNMMIDRNFIAEMSNEMSRNYRDLYHTEPFPTVENSTAHMATITPDIIYRMSKSRLPDVEEVLNNDSDDHTFVEENESDEEMAQQLQEMSTYLMSLSTNSYGQRLNWETTTQESAIDIVSSTDLTFASHRLDVIQLQIYNNTYAKYFSYTNKWDSIKSFSWILLFINISISIGLYINQDRIILGFFTSVLLIILFIINTLAWYIFEREWLKNTQLYYSHFNNIFASVIQTQISTRSTANMNQLLHFMQTEKK